MEEYSFEYADRGTAIKLLLLSFAIFIFLLLSIIVTKDFIGIIPGILIAFAVPIIIFWRNSKRIKAHGTAVISDSYVQLKLKDVNETIQFIDVKRYMIVIYIGITLKLRIINKRTLRISAHDSYCNPTQFGLFCDNLEQALRKFQLVNKTELTEEKFIFEKKWFFYVMLVLTAGVVCAIFYAITYGTKTPLSIIGWVFLVISMWATYSTAKKRRKARVA